MLGVYVLIMFMSSWWILPLSIVKCPSVCLFMAFVLQSILSDITIATPAFFSCSFAWNIFSNPPLSVYVGLLFWGGSLVGSTCVGNAFLSIHLLYTFFFGTFNPFMFKVIIDRYLFTANFSYQCPSDSLPFPSFPESSPFLISCSAGLVETYSFFFFFLLPASVSNYSCMSLALDT